MSSTSQLSADDRLDGMLGQFKKKTVRDIDVRERCVMVRVDFNVPLRGSVPDCEVVDDQRIRAALPTVRYLREQDARLVLVSHLGRPEGTDPELSMAPVSKRLSELLGCEVTQSPEVVGKRSSELANELGPKDILVLENSRFEQGETKNDPQLSDRLAALADIYVDDAFGAVHRAHATTVGVAERLPAVAGLLVERELDALEGLVQNPERPFVVALGGAKVSDKVALIKRFLGIADTVLVGGAMCFSFFKAQGHSVGNSLVEAEGIALAGELLVLASNTQCALELPVDLVAGSSFDQDCEVLELDSTDVPDGWMGLDIGPRTAARYGESVRSAGTVFWNGPMGVFELDPFAAGTRSLAEAVAGSKAWTVVGGGDSAAAIGQFGLVDQIDRISTGGGAALEFLEGAPLPGIEVLEDKTSEGTATVK